MSVLEKPESIRLADVDKVWPDGMPPVIDDNRKRGSLEELLRVNPANIFRAIRHELQTAAENLRAGRPHGTTLFSLESDPKTVGQIAAETHEDPRDIVPVLDKLTAVGLANRDSSKPLTRFTLRDH